MTGLEVRQKTTRRNVTGTDGKHPLPCGDDKVCYAGKCNDASINAMTQRESHDDLMEMRGKFASN